MNRTEQKLVQYLIEARATERALIRVLQAQIAMTPRGSYRSALEDHLEETRDHAARVTDRLRTLDTGSSPVTTIVGFGEDLLGQTLALGKASFDLLRGSGGEEKVLKNAKDACASESLEIATYTALERVARRVGDGQTAELAADILQDEQRMLARVMQELPRLADAVVGADIEGEPSYDVTDTGAADVAEAAARRGDDDLPLSGYDALTVAQIVNRLPDLSQVDLATIDAYERSHKNRAGVLRATRRHRVA